MQREASTALNKNKKILPEFSLKDYKILKNKHSEFE